MKKLISLLLGICIISTLLPIMSVASATTPSGATLIFDMNLDGLTAESGSYVTDGVANSVPGTTTAIVGMSRIAAAAEGETPAAGSEDRPILRVDEENGFKFLEFSRLGDATTQRFNTQAGLEVTFNDEAYFNSNEFTFETWARGTNLNSSKDDNDNGSGGNYYAYQGLFTLGTKPSDSQMYFRSNPSYIGTFISQGSAHSLFNLGLSSGNVETCIKNGFGVTTADPSANHTFGGVANTLKDYEDELVHYAITMKWELDTATEDSETDGTWTAELYIDGEKKYTLTRKEDSRHIFTDEEITTLLIGAAPQHVGSPTFCGDIADFKMYTGVRTAAEIKATYEAESVAYLPFELTNGAELTAAATTPLNVNGGEIEIKFNQPVDKSSLDTITFTDGTHYPAAVVETTNGAKIKFGHLNEGETYTLTIPSSLKSVFNKTLGQAYTYTFKAGTKQYVVNENFDSYSAGDKLKETTTADGSRAIFYVSTTFSTNYDTSDENAKIAVDAESGDKYLHITAPSTGTGVNTYLLVSVPTNYNKMTTLALTGGDNDINVFDLGVRGSHAQNAGSSVVTALGNRDTDTATTKTPVAFTSTGQMYSPKGNTILADENDNQFNLGEDGFYNTRMVTRLTGNKGGTNNQEQLMAFDLYDMNERKLLGTIANGNDIYEADSMRYYIAGYVYSNNAANDANYVDVTSVKMYEEKYLEVLDISDFDASTHAISLKMSDDVDAASLETITAVKTTAPEGNAVSPIDADYDARTRTLTLTFAEDALENNADYTLDMSGVVTQNLIPFEIFEDQMGPHTFVAKETATKKLDVVLKNQDGDVIAGAQGLAAATEVKATLTVTNFEDFETLSPVSILALYEGDRLVKVKACADKAEWIKDNVTGAYSKTVAIDGLAGVSVDNAKVFLWKDFASLSPLYSATLLATRKVICVGNSTTHNGGGDELDYPYHLADILEENQSGKYIVENYGKSGSTVVTDKPEKAYVNTQEYTDSLQANADIILICQGTNDASATNWTDGTFNADTFKDHYGALIDDYKTTYPKAEIYLLTPMSAYPGSWGNVYASMIPAEITPAIKELATAKNIDCIDLTAFTANHSEWFYDGLHPNSDGALAVAQFIYQQIFAK